MVCGILLKACVKNVNKSRTRCPKNFVINFDVWNCLVMCGIFNMLCRYNKTVIYFWGILNIFYFAHVLFYLIVYRQKIAYLLRIHQLAFLFYQISRLIIIICSMIMISFGATNFEIYIYLLIITVISSYMFLVNYFNTLQYKIKYSSVFQGIFNYPFEWMNLFCLFCENSNKDDNEINCGINSCLDKYCVIQCCEQDDCGNCCDCCLGAESGNQRCCCNNMNCKYLLCCNFCWNCYLCCDDFDFLNSCDDFDKYNEK